MLVCTRYATGAAFAPKIERIPITWRHGAAAVTVFHFSKSREDLGCAQESRREGWTDARSAVGFCLGSGLFGSYNSD